MPDEPLSQEAPHESATYGPMLQAIQDMWEEHDERAAIGGDTGGCGCEACSTAIAFFQAACASGEAKRGPRG
jgi:hypothetical protein